MRIDLIGPVPPPLGGVSVHLLRLAERLTALGQDVRRHGPQQRSLHFAYHASLARAIRGADVVHVHTHGMRDLVLLSFTGRIHHHMLWTAHGDVVRSQFDNLPTFGKSIVRNALQTLAAVVAVNGQVAQDLLDVGVGYSRIHVISPFIPPVESERNQPALPNVEMFCRRHYPVVCAAAFTLADDGSVPLYGIDLAVEAIAGLCRRFANAGLIVHIATLQHDDWLRLGQLKERCRKLGIEDNVLFLLDSVPFGPTLNRSQILLRPTATDGDAVTVREALHVGIPVVASDVVSRPEGTTLFRHRDVDDFTAKLVCVAENRQQHVPRPQPDATGPLLDLYRRIAHQRFDVRPRVTNGLK
ncbi:MAG: glycosyltransferase [Myxococcales bacterium]|nr:glycosyltransferase [Myxococcales bacterium]